MAEATAAIARSGTARSSQVDPGCCSADLVGTSEDAANLDADGRQCPRERQTRASGPDDTNRCHCELSSFRPCHQVPFVSQFPPSLPTMCRSRDAGSVSASVAPPTRRNTLGVEILERRQHEAPLGHPGMGHDKVRLANLQITDQEDVDVERAGSVAHGANPACESFEPLRHFEQLAGSPGRYSSRTTQLRYLC